MLSKLKIIAGALLLTCLQSYCAQLTVSKDGTGQYTSIQSAVNASSSGDVITITDNAVYNERVVIKGKENLTLQSLSNDNSVTTKPSIKWLDIENVGPTNAQDALIEEKITFEQNGALLIWKCKNIVISGLKIDGGSPTPFAYNGIWSGKDPLFHGNDGISILQSGSVTVRYCEITNSYFGIYLKDRNEGGIFANANPSDIANWNVIPLSNFGKTGNHVIELNRICNNSYGLFFESSWDLGSTVRYNRIYENHHSTELYEKVKWMPDGGNQPGGAILLKDQMLSPLAIYNNTFWHNSLLFVGHWEAGLQHLVFNNIFAQPDAYWSKVASLTTFMELSPGFLNRMHNCLYSAQQQAPDTRTQTYQYSMTDPVTGLLVEGNSTYTGVSGVQITNWMNRLQTDGATVAILLKRSTGDTIIYTNAEWAIQPGALLTGISSTMPYPTDASVRWLEMKFKSTDPLSPDFLTPDLSDTIISRYVKNGGWKESGVYNNNGSIADIGAPALSIDKPMTNNIIPLDPAQIINSHMILHFNLNMPEETFKNPKVTYARLVKNLPFDATAFGLMPKLIINTANIIPVDLTIKNGVNVLELSIPFSDSTDQSGFVEMVVSGQNGSNVSNVVGFIPYRKLYPQLSIKLLDLNTKNPITTITKGEKVILNITVNTKDKPALSVVDLHLLSGEKVLNADGGTFKIDTISDSSTTAIITFDHTGTDALVIGAQGVLDLKNVFPTGCSSLFTITSSSPVINTKNKKETVVTNSRYVLFSINGKKVGTYTMNQLQRLQISKMQQTIPSGIYCAFLETTSDKKYLTGEPIKVVVPK